MNAARRFIFNGHRSETCSKTPRPTAISLFSGAGLSDFGYSRAGFDFVVQLEANAYRAQLGQDNLRDSKWIVGDIRAKWKEVVSEYRAQTRRPLDFLVATPPCQGMSSSNPTRGKRSSGEARQHEEKNSLMLAIVPVVVDLRPRIVVIENIRQLLTLEVARAGAKRPVMDVLREELANYQFFSGVVDVADYGVPQTRKRAVIVGIEEREHCLPFLLSEGRVPWPKPTHGSNRRRHISVGRWLRRVGYESLDASSSVNATGTHPLHFVPHYDPDRYLQISSIPKNSGRSAYENEHCPECGHDAVPQALVRCNVCGGLMRNRPYTFINRKPRLIAGFHSSYRRMASNRPAPTITTNSSHVGSDYKVHPFENRVLSILECADIQTVPRGYVWKRALEDGRTYMIRVVTGEAFPPFFTFLHGRTLIQLLSIQSRTDSKVIAAALRRCATPQKLHA